MKQYTIMLLAVLIIITGCTEQTKMSPTYQFSNTVEEIVSIDLLHNRNENASGTDEAKFHLMRTLEEDEIISFMEDVYMLETSYCISPPLWGYGLYIARVEYANGDVEMLGSKNIEYIENGSVPNGVGAYYFVDHGLETVISEYVDLTDFSKIY